MPPDQAHVRDDPSATASFYDATAARYDAEVDGLAANALLRDAFRGRVSAAAGTGTPILDFGCGTGTDAAWYAARGHRVIAYDPSHGMIAVLRERCATEIAEESIRPIAGDLELLGEELERAGPVAAIAANFAVLNHVRDLRALFGTLAPYLVPDGVIVAIVLNPFSWRDMTHGWWWRGLPGSLWTGAIKVSGQVTTYRHYMRAVRRMASPRFELIERKGASSVVNARSPARESLRETLADNFLFLLLRKRQ